MLILHRFFKLNLSATESFFVVVIIVVRLSPFTRWDGWRESVKRGQHLEDVTCLCWNWPFQGWNSAVVFPWFTILGLHFRSKAEDYRLFTDVLNSEFLSNSEMLCLFEN